MFHGGSGGGGRRGREGRISGLTGRRDPSEDTTPFPHDALVVGVRRFGLSSGHGPEGAPTPDCTNRLTTPANNSGHG